jgi:hypothetical protein
MSTCFFFTSTITHNETNMYQGSPFELRIFFLKQPQYVFLNSMHYLHLILRPAISSQQYALHSIGFCRSHSGYAYQIQNTFFLLPFSFLFSFGFGLSSFERLPLLWRSTNKSRHWVQCFLFAFREKPEIIVPRPLWCAVIKQDMTEQAVEPLKQLLESIVDRLAAIECKVGIEGGGGPGGRATTGASPSTAAAQGMMMMIQD